MLLPAPGRLSMTTCWPNSSETSCDDAGDEVGAAAGRERRDRANDAMGQACACARRKPAPAATADAVESWTIGGA
jgi:hypothetical protein